jgi:hypothetical protein
MTRDEKKAQRSALRRQWSVQSRWAPVGHRRLQPQLADAPRHRLPDAWSQLYRRPQLERRS